MKQFLKKAISLVLALTLLATMVVSVAAADDVLINTDKTGSLTVYKFANRKPLEGNPGKPAAGEPGSGTEDDEGTEEEPGIPEGNEPLVGSTFTVAQLKTVDGEPFDIVAYYDGTTVYDLENGVLVYDTAKVLTDNGDGSYTIDGLKLGVYLVTETDAPDQITNPLMEAFKVSIPMVNSATSANNNNAKWLYDVVVYPKNHESRANVELTKLGLVANKKNDQGKDATVELGGVKFSLERYNEEKEKYEAYTYKANDGTDLPSTLVTNNSGVLLIKDLPSGRTETKYQLVEIETVDGYILNKTPLRFTVHADNSITWDATGNSNTGVKTTTTNPNITTDATTNEKTLNIEMLNLQPDLHKYVWDDKNGNGEKEGNEWVADASYETKDTLEYKIEVDVPYNIGELKKFEITDKPSNGLIVDVETIEIAGLGTPANGIWELDTNDSNVAFTIKIDTEKLATSKVNKLVITYSATFNGSVELNGNGNVNEATLTYDSVIGADPEDNTPKQIKDEVRVYTFGHLVTKTLEEGGDPTGVKFMLYRKGETTAIPVTEENGGDNKQYRIATVDDLKDLDPDDYNYIMETNSTGVIMIRGLDNGEYALKEIQTVPGYNLLSELYSFTVETGRKTNWTEENLTFKNGVKDVKDLTKTTYTKDNPLGTSTVLNKKGFVLPQTGSMGYLLFCSAGLVLVVAGAMLILSDRKRKIR